MDTWDIQHWWPQLNAQSQRWLVAHNGEEVASPVAADISSVVGGIPAHAPWLADAHPSGLILSDAATDWIEAAANGEH